MKISLLCLSSFLGTLSAFTPIIHHRQTSLSCRDRTCTGSTIITRFAESSSEAEGGKEAVDVEYTFESQEEKEKAVGNLVADDEWSGLGMELSEVITKAVVEDMKNNAKEFLGKDDYAVGDITKEVDSRMKDEIAKMRGKEEYELGDLICVMDEMSKKMVEDATGKPYEVGDLSTLIDTGVKDSVAKFCGKDEYEVGDLSLEMSKRIENGVNEFTGRDTYEFGDISREIENRRQKWAEEFLGKEAAANYQFGDLTKKALANLSGDDNYQFGDITKKALGNIFGKKK